MRCTLSVAIITRNEEVNLRRTLSSVLWADQLIVVDAQSTDQTVTLAQSTGAEVIVEEWKGFAAQKNLAIANCTCDWILSLDADEELTADLAAEIQTLLAENPPCDAYTLPRRNFFLGRALRYGGFYPDRKLRLFRRGSAKFTDRPVHETMACSGTVGHLQGDLLHHAYPTLPTYIEHMDRYSTLGAEILIRSGRISRNPITFTWNVAAAPFLNFFYSYVLRFGFLDGREGLLMHLYHASYVSWKYAKAWHSAK